MGDSSCLSLVQQWLYTYYGCGCLQSATEVDVNGLDGLCATSTAGRGGDPDGTPEGFDATLWLTFTIDGSQFSGAIVGMSSGTQSHPDGGPVYGTVSGSFDGTIDSGGATGSLSGGFSLTANGEGFSGSLSADVYENGITDGELLTGDPLTTFHGALQGGGGGIVGSSNPSGETTTYQRNADDQVTSVTDPMDNTTDYSYDKNGNVLSVTDGNGHTTDFAYNGLGKIGVSSFFRQK